MSHFKVSAPGKVILYGEHGVVYGTAAVAASLNLRTFLEYRELKNEDKIRLNFAELNVDVSVPLQKVREHFFADEEDQSGILENDREEFCNRVRKFVLSIEFQRDDRLVSQLLSLEAFFFLLIYMSRKEKFDVKSFEIRVESKSTIGAGLGSSASFAVCLAACFLRLSRNRSTLGENDLSLVSTYAFECEKIVHGTPSGVDNSICTYGHFIEFKKDAYMRRKYVDKEMRILLVDSKVPKNTKAMVAKVAGLKTTYPVIFEAVFRAIDDISKNAIEAIQRIQDIEEDDEQAILEEYDNLMTLIRMNQGLLSTCHASHPSLDKICLEAQKHGLAAKLTGSGGGGYAYILLYPNTQYEVISSISKKLTEDGYSVKLTTLGCSGVQIHD